MMEQAATLARYLPETGRIMAVVTCPPAMAASMAMPGEQAVYCAPDVMDTTHYVLHGAVQPRPTCPALLDGMTLRDLPVPCAIRINGVSYDCAEPTAELEFDQPGAYSIRVTAWPYRNADFEVTHENPAQ